MPTDRLTQPVDSDCFVPAQSQDSNPQPNWQGVNRLLLAATWQIPEADLEFLLPLLERRPAIQISLLFPGADWILAHRSPAAVTRLDDDIRLISELSRLRFDAAIIFTQPFESPYSLAYLLYLAKIPIRVGQSCEFGGSLLSHSFQPSYDLVHPDAHQIHFLNSIGLVPPPGAAA